MEPAEEETVGQKEEGVLLPPPPPLLLWIPAVEAGGEWGLALSKYFKLSFR